jgi:hypothetical protein
MAVTLFTSWAQVARKLSATGIQLRVDHSPDDAFNDAAESASLYVLGVIGNRYSAAQLAASPWVSLVTADICIWFLDQMRNNPVGGSIDDRKEMWDKQLQMIQQGKANVNDITNSVDRPEILGQRINYNQYPAMRRTDAGSTDYRPQGGRQYPDSTEPPLR